MLFQTHLLFSLILSIYFKEVFNLSLVFVLIAVISSSLPDIDTTRSWIGRRLKIISYMLELAFKHRTLTHSIWPILLFGFIFYLNNMKIITFGLLVGYSSHLLLDSFTIQGIQPLYPVRYKIKGIFKTGGIFEKIIFYSMVILTIIYLTYKLQ